MMPIEWQPRLMAVLAHPDDESLGFGGTFAKCAADGIHTTLVTATRGERGWSGDPARFPGPVELARLRERELAEAAVALSIDRVALFDEPDGELANQDPVRVTAKIVAEIRNARPDIVVTFGPDGAYGHPDHIAISQLATAAVVAAADPGFEIADPAPAHHVSKLYYRIWTASEERIYKSVFGDVAIDVDGCRRRWLGWPDWSVSARLDTADYWSEVSEAVACHRSQIIGVTALETMRPIERRLLWGTQNYYRAMSTVDTGFGIETDLFTGLFPAERL
jgi:LmbE family N-acetylglucosaminyl deacetylase